MTVQEVEAIIDLAKEKFTNSTPVYAIKEGRSGCKGICIPCLGWFTMTNGELVRTEPTRRSSHPLRVEDFENALEAFSWNFPKEEISAMVGFKNGIEINNHHFWSLTNDVFLTE